MNAIPEKDWKLLKSMKDAKLNQVCEQILWAVSSVIINKGNENHKAYLEVWEKVQTGDSDVAEMFNDLRRSNAVLKLAVWQRYGLLAERELNEFSEETKSTIVAIAGKR